MPTEGQTPENTNPEPDLNAMRDEVRRRAAAGETIPSLEEVIAERVARGDNVFHDFHLVNPALHPDEANQRPSAESIRARLAQIRQEESGEAEHPTL